MVLGIGLGAMRAGPEVMTVSNHAASHDTRTTPMSPPEAPTTARFLGIRRPGRLAIAMFRVPLAVYQRGWGRLLGHTFLVFTHVGRRSGRPHDTVAMVLAYDRDSQESVICSAWGPDTDWVRNLHAHPATLVRVGRESYTPAQRFLTDDEAFAVAARFRQQHPWRLRLLSAILGWGDLRADDAARAFVRTRPFVAFHPDANQAH